MRWNCPHCEVSLAVADDKLGSGWSFSRCYSCGGFALVRRAALSVIKVDRAPAGETVLMPEAGDEHAMAPKLNATAKENFDRLGVKPAAPRAAQVEAQPLPPPIPATAAAAVAEANRLTEIFSADVVAEGGRGLFVNRPMLVLAIGITTTLAASSGYYLFSEGQELWEKARTPNQDRRSDAGEAIRGDAPEVLRPAGDPTLARGEGVTDEVRLQAMAPTRDGSAVPPTAPITNYQMSPDAPTQPSLIQAQFAIPPQPQVPTQIAPDALASTQARAIPAPAPIQGPQPPRADAKKIAPAPANEPTAEIQQPTPLVVRIRTNEARLHAGPGVQYPIVAMARPDTRYAVADWSDRWFKVAIKLPSGPTMAWIRNDQVLISPAGANESLPAQH